MSQDRQALKTHYDDVEWGLSRMLQEIIGVSRIWPRWYPQLAKWAPHISVGPHGHRAPYKTVISLFGFHQ